MTSLVFEKLAQTLAAAEQWCIGVAGDFFRVAGCDWPVTVALYLGGREVGRMAGVQAGDYVRDVPFDQVRVTNGATGQAVSVQIAGGGVGSDRVLGEVSVIEGGASRSRAGVAFSGANRTTAGVGLYPHVQLWNPAGSGVRAIVSEVGIDASAALDVGVRWAAAPLTTLAATPNGVSKLAGAAGSVCEVRSEANAAVLGSPMYGIGADTKHLIHKLTEPIVLEPGYGLIVASVTVNTSVRANFQFYEETQ